MQEEEEKEDAHPNKSKQFQEMDDNSSLWLSDGYISFE